MRQKTKIVVDYVAIADAVFFGPAPEDLAKIAIITDPQRQPAFVTKLERKGVNYSLFSYVTTVPVED